MDLSIKLLEYSVLIKAIERNIKIKLGNKIDAKKSLLKAQQLGNEDAAGYFKYCNILFFKFSN